MEIKKIVKATKIIGTSTIVMSVWEPMDGHRAITTFNGVWYGRVGSRPLPSELDALQALSHERAERVREWQNAQYEEAYQAITERCPWLATEGRRCAGEITYSR